METPYHSFPYYTEKFMSIFDIFLSPTEKKLKQIFKQLKNGEITELEYYSMLYDIDYEKYTTIVPDHLSDKITTQKHATKLTKQFNMGDITKDEYISKIKTIDIDKWKQYATTKEIAEYDLEQQFKAKEISENDYYRELATLDKRPYVNITNIEMDSKGIGTHSIEFDWNEYFIANLKENGFTGNTEEELVDKWFITVSTAIASESEAVIVTNPEDFTKLSKSGKTEHY